MDINDIILIKFLNGECSTDELQAVERWLEADEAHGKELFGWEAAHRMAGASSMGGREVEQRLRKLHGRIDAECRKTDRRVCRRQWLLRAAIFVGVIIMGAAVCWLVGEDGILRSPKMLVASTSGPHSRVVRLADGSTVWLKAGSQLRYPATFDGKERRVELSGEGYFEVAKDHYHPFVVEGGAVDVRVLGTKFDFSTDTKKRLASVSLIEGAVEVKDVKRKGLLQLKPNQRLTVNTQTGLQEVEHMDTRIVAAWHNRLIPFTNANVGDIAHTIRALYGVKVSVAPDVDESQTYSGAVYLASSVDSVMALVKSTVPISYHRKGNTVWIEKE